MSVNSTTKNNLWEVTIINKRNSTTLLDTCLKCLYVTSNVIYIPLFSTLSLNLPVDEKSIIRYGWKVCIVPLYAWKNAVDQIYGWNVKDIFRNQPSKIHWIEIT